MQKIQIKKIIINKKYISDIPLFVFKKAFILFVINIKIFEK